MEQEQACGHDVSTSNERDFKARHIRTDKKTQPWPQKTVTFHLMFAYLHQVRFQMRMVALVQTQVLIAIPVPNMENRLIFSTMRLGRFLMVHSGIGLLV